MYYKFCQTLQKNYGIWLTSLIATLLLTLIRYTGALQPIEWFALDFLFNRKSSTNLSKEIVIVNLSEKDIQQLEEYPLSDATLTQLIRNIKQQEPRVIGLGIFRNIAVPSSLKNIQENQQAHRELLEIFRTTSNLFGIEKVTQDSVYEQIKPSPILKQLQRTTSADIIIDGDGIVRRGILFPVTDGSDASTIPSLGLAVALNYLEKEGINPTQNQDGWLKLKDTIFLPFKSNDGSYIRADDRGYQILINWWSKKNQFTKISVSDVLNNNIESDLLRDRIVLIGTTAVSVNNVFYTPYIRDNHTNPIGLYGIEIQAHLANYIIDTTINNQPLIKVSSEWWEYIWFAANIIVITLWGWNQRNSQKPLRLLLIIFSGTIVLSVFLIVITYFAFLHGWWIPIIPTLMGIFGGALTVSGCIYVDKLHKANINLETQVANRTKELDLTIENLQKTQSQLIAKEKLSTLGRISAGIAHEIRNPLNLINLNAQLLSEQYNHFLRKIEENKYFFEDVIEEIFEDNNDFLLLEDKINIIREQVKRGEKIIQDILFYTPSRNPEFSQINLAEFITETLTLVQQENEINNFTLKPIIQLKIDNNNLQIPIIINDFRRALINILENSYDSLREKKTSLAEFIPYIYIEIKDCDSIVKIIIRDNGKGIEEDKMDKIFLPFYTQKKAGKGTGLGLFLTQEIIVGEHQGNIQVQSRFTEYCQFIISLPKSRSV